MGSTVSLFAARSPVSRVWGLKNGEHRLFLRGSVSSPSLVFGSWFRTRIRTVSGFVNAHVFIVFSLEDKAFNFLGFEFECISNGNFIVLLPRLLKFVAASFIPALWA
jgi:hypothetical protein